MKLRFIVAIALAAAAPAWAPTWAQVAPSQLASEAAEQLRSARAGLEAARTAADRVAALTRTIDAYEAGLEAMREGLRRAALREAEITSELDTESERVGELLGVLLTMQSMPDGLSLIHPSGPLGTARAGIILADVTPAFQVEVDRLRTRLNEVSSLRGLQEDATFTLTEALSGVQEARTELSQAISNRTDLPRRFISDPAQLARLVENADTLEMFADGLGDLSSANGEDPLPDLADAMGTLPLPVEGTVLRRADEADAAGIRRPGWVLATRAQALVRAPWPATIRYLGPFLDYGNVMILEPGNDVLVVLAGLDQVYGDVGQVVPAGTPVGLMGGAPADPDAFLGNVTDGGGVNATETLYMEIRQGGQPVDPGQWFAAN